MSVVVVSYNAMPWIERALESVRGRQTVVVDHGSTDGTVAFVSERFPEVTVVEEENRGLAFGWNTGVARTSGAYVLLLNADAWMHAGALEELIACFPVYRSYVRPETGKVNDADRQHIMTAIRRAKRRNPTISESIFDFIGSVLLLEHPGEIGDAERY